MKLPASLLWKWHRLRAMSPAEIRERIHERFFLPDDCKIPGELSGFDLGTAVPLPGFLPDPALAPDSLRTEVSSRAEDIRAGTWIIFDSHTFQTTLPPNWHRDPLSGGQAPADAPSRALDHRTCPNGCDPRVIWELSRFLQPVVLAQDVFLNDNTPSATCLLELLEDWAIKNPMGYGLNGCSALEAGLRLINLTWIDALLENRLRPDLSERWHSLIRKLIPEHVLFLNRHLSPGSSANNHLLGELTGLSLAISRWPALATLGKTLPWLQERLHRETLRQFATDGGNVEQALHYHLFAWELLWHALRLQTLPIDVGDRLAAAADFYTAMTPDSSPAWDFGDGDDAAVTPLCIRPPALEWKQWFLKSPTCEGLAYWLGPCPFSPPEVTPGATGLFPVSGMAALRSPNGWARLDASPLGLPPMYAHGHLDTLHVSLWLNNLPVLIDPGTGAYYADAAWRTRLADADSHNGPSPIPAAETPKRLGPFLWSGPLPDSILKTSPNQITASFRSIGRTVRFADPEWIIEDTLPADPPHHIRFVLAPEWSPQANGTESMTFTHPTGACLQIHIEAEAALSRSLESFEVSPHFRTRQTAHAITLRAKGSVRTTLQLT